MKITFPCLIAAILISASQPSVAGVYDDILFAANQSKTTEVIDLLRRGMDINTTDPQGNTLLIIAVRENNSDLAKFLLENRANPYKRNRYGDTALMIAALQGLDDIAKLLLNYKVEVNQSGWNALHYAAFENRRAIVKMLLSAGAKVDAPAPNSQTALMLAAKRGQLESVRLLIDAKADLNQVDSVEGSAVAMAIKGNHSEVADLLRKAGGR
jgi:hypothetical protein